MRIATAALIALFAIGLGASEGVAQSIDWEVVGRFRLFTNPRDQNTYLNARQAILEAKGYRPPLLQPRNDSRLGWDINWPTRWDEKREQYERDWVHDKHRKVRIKLV